MTITLTARKVMTYGALSIMALFVGVIVYWSFSTRKQVLVINNDPVTIRPSEVNAGDGIVYLKVDYCKNAKATGQTKVYLIGETYGAKPEVAWPDDTAAKGCQVLEFPVHIPAQTQTDMYHIVFEVKYQLNPIRDSYTTFRSRTFKVINEKQQPGDAKPVTP